MSVPLASRARSRSGAALASGGERTFQRTLSLKRVHDEVAATSRDEPESLEAGVIHRLPVKIIYDVVPTPGSPACTLLAYPVSLQSAFVHLPDDRGRKHESAAADAPHIASLYLKGVVEGLCFASPELGLDAQESDLAPPRDHIVQVLDPRCPSTAPTWTGSGLLSWPLAEPRDGTTMVQGRVVRDEAFALAAGCAAGEGLEGLARLVCGDAGPARGLGVEVRLRLRPIVDPPPNPRTRNERAPTSDAQYTSSTAILATPHLDRELAPGWSSPLPAGMLTPGFDPEALRLAVFGDGVAREAIAGKRSQRSAEKRKRAQRDAVDDGAGRQAPGAAASEWDAAYAGFNDATQEVSTDVLGDEAGVAQGVQPLAATLVPTDPADTPAPASDAPGNLSLPHAPHVYAGDPKAATAAARTGPKRRRKMPAADGQGCSNCGKTETTTWRQKAGSRVCNPCGIYYNVHKVMRPQELWGRGKKAAAKRAEAEARAAAAAAATVAAKTVNSVAAQRAAIRARKAEAFKRTLTTFVEMEAERIRTKKAGQPKSGTKNVRGEVAGETASRQPLAEVPSSTAGQPPNTAPPSASSDVLADLDLSGLDPAMIESIQNGTFVLPPELEPQQDDDVDFGAWFTFSQSQSQQSQEPAGERDAAPPHDSFAMFDALLPDGPPSSAFLDPTPPGSTPFDFSQLPPSSPPIMTHDLHHSHLLLSSPGTSPTAFTPSSDKTTPDDTYATPEATAPPSSGRSRTSFSAQSRPAVRHPLASVAAVAGTNSDESQPPSDEQFRALMAEFEHGQ